MKVPDIFVPEKDLEKEINTLVMLDIPDKKPIIEAEEFHDTSVYRTLIALLDKNYDPLFMPSIIDMRIEAPKDAIIWQNWYCTPSIKVTGRTEGRNVVVVYAHITNYFSNPDSIKDKWKGLADGAGIMPDKEFHGLLDLEDNKNVFVVDYKTLMGSESGVILLKDALKHPQTIPFLGGKERAEKYLERHKEVDGEKIGIFCSDDFIGHDRPFGRLLFIGGKYDYGLGIIFESGRFIGVRR